MKRLAFRSDTTSKTFLLWQKFTQPNIHIEGDTVFLLIFTWKIVNPRTIVSECTYVTSVITHTDIKL